MTTTMSMTMTSNMCSSQPCTSWCIICNTYTSNGQAPYSPAVTITTISFFRATSMCYAYKPRISSSINRSYAIDKIRARIMWIYAYLHRYVSIRQLRRLVHAAICIRSMKHSSNRFKRIEHVLIPTIDACLDSDGAMHAQRALRIRSNKLVYEQSQYPNFNIDEFKYIFSAGNLVDIEDTYYASWDAIEQSYYVSSYNMRTICDIFTYSVKERSDELRVLYKTCYTYSSAITMYIDATSLSLLSAVAAQLHQALRKQNEYADERRIHFPGIVIPEALDKRVALWHFWGSNGNILNQLYMLSEIDAVKGILVARAGILFKRWVAIRSRDDKRIRRRFSAISVKRVIDVMRRNRETNVIYCKVISILGDYRYLLSKLFFGRIRCLVDKQFIRFASNKLLSSDITYSWVTQHTRDMTWDKRIKYLRYLNTKYIQPGRLTSNVQYSYRLRRSIYSRRLESEYIMALYAKRTFWRYRHVSKRVAVRDVSWRAITYDIHSYLYEYSYDKQKYSERYGEVHIANGVTAVQIISDIRFMLRDKQSDSTSHYQTREWLLSLDNMLQILLHTYTRTAFNILVKVVHAFTKSWSIIRKLVESLISAYIYVSRVLKYTVASISYAIEQTSRYIERVYVPLISEISLELARHEVPDTLPHKFFTNLPGILYNLRDKQKQTKECGDSFLQAMYDIVVNYSYITLRICLEKAGSAVSFGYTLTNIVSSSWSYQLCLLVLEILHSSRDKQRNRRMVKRSLFYPSRYERKLYLAECLWNRASTLVSDMLNMWYIDVISDANAYYISRWFIHNMFSCVLRNLYKSMDPVSTAILKRILHSHKVWRCFPDASWEQTFYMHKRHKVIPDACHILMEGYVANMHRLHTDINLYRLFDYDLVYYDCKWFKWDVFDTMSLSVQYLDDLRALYPHTVVENNTLSFSNYLHTLRVKCVADIGKLIIYNTEILFICAGVLRQLLLTLIGFYSYGDKAPLAIRIRLLFEALESHIENSYYSLRTKYQYQYNHSRRIKHKTSNGALMYLDMFEALCLKIALRHPRRHRNPIALLRFTRRYLRRLAYVRRFDIACTVSSVIGELTGMIEELIIAEMELLCSGLPLREIARIKVIGKDKAIVIAEAKAAYKAEYKAASEITRFWYRISKYLIHKQR